jgi:hypothetical protein
VLARQILGGRFHKIVLSRERYPILPSQICNDLHKISGLPDYALVSCSASLCGSLHSVVQKDQPRHHKSRQILEHPATVFDCQLVKQSYNRHIFTLCIIVLVDIWQIWKMAYANFFNSGNIPINTVSLHKLWKKICALFLASILLGTQSASAKLVATVDGSCFCFTAQVTA